jgi:oxygen-dependent protoporphyrinogen oxidase
MKEIIIVGGGITGLAAAYRLQSLTSDVHITLIERDGRLGGKIVTERVDGFILEGAPDCFLSRKPRGIALCEELGVIERLQGRNPAYTKTYVMRDGQLYLLPEGLTGMVPTNFEALSNSPLISATGRAELAQELEKPALPANGDESIASFMTRRLGKEVFEQLIEPLMGGIYGGDTKQLSLGATFPHLRKLELEHGSLIKGLLAKQASLSKTASAIDIQKKIWDRSNDARSSGPAETTEVVTTVQKDYLNIYSYPPFVSFRNGMAELIEIMQERLSTPQTTIMTGHGVEAIAKKAMTSEREGYSVSLTDGRTLHADALILTTPAFITAKLIAPWDADLAAAHQAIPYASTVTMSLAYPEAKVPRELDGRGYLIPASEGKKIKACTWSSSKWEGRAPDGYALIRLYLGRYGSPDILANSDEQLLSLAKEELADTLKISAEPDFYRIYRWPNTMPQYNLGHLERLATINQRLTHHKGLFLAGAAYRGVGIPDCIHSGEEAARGVVNCRIVN